MFIFIIKYVLLTLQDFSLDYVPFRKGWFVHSSVWCLLASFPMTPLLYLVIIPTVMLLPMLFWSIVLNFSVHSSCTSWFYDWFYHLMYITHIFFTDSTVHSYLQRSLSNPIASPYRLLHFYLWDCTWHIAWTSVNLHASVFGYLWIWPREEILFVDLFADVLHFVLIVTAVH